MLEIEHPSVRHKNQVHQCPDNYHQESDAPAADEGTSKAESVQQPRPAPGKSIFNPR